MVDSCSTHNLEYTSFYLIKPGLCNLCGMTVRMFKGLSKMDEMPMPCRDINLYMPPVSPVSAVSTCSTHLSPQPECGCILVSHLITILVLNMASIA